MNIENSEIFTYGSQDWKNMGVPHQQFCVAGDHHLRPLQVPLAGRVVLQACPEQGRRMDQAASAYQKVLWQF